MPTPSSYSFSLDFFDVAVTAQEVLEKIEDFRKTHQGHITIFTDVDDTLIVPCSQTFKNPLYKNLIDEIKAHPERYPNSAEIISNWRLQRKVMLVDPQWPQILLQLQNIGSVYALTKMEVGSFGNIPSMEQWRYQELKALDLLFSSSLTNMEFASGKGSFTHGIIMTGSQKKSQALRQFFSIFNDKETMVLVDDRKEHLEDVAHFCRENHIQFKGILFDGLSLFSQEVDLAVVKHQKHHLLEFGQWLEDADAKKQLSSQ